MTRLSVPLAAIALALGISSVAAAAPIANVRVGDPHPDFTLPSIYDGQPVSLSDFRGRKVLLIHFASW